MEKFIKRCNNIPYKKVEGEVLLLNLKDGNYFGLNKTGYFIWEMLDGTKTRCGIIKTLQKKFKIRKDVAKRDLDDFLSQAKKHKLIEFI